MHETNLIHHHSNKPREVKASTASLRGAFP